ncbi:uncharacterized protein RB166_018611 [Leptodactylus fuscus]
MTTTNDDRNETTAYVLSTVSQVVTDILNTTIYVSSYPQDTTTPAKKEQNLGLIIGLSVGIPCGVALIIALAGAIFYFYFYKKKTPQKSQHEGSDTFYEITISRTQSNYYDDVAIPSRNNEPVYDTTLQTYNSTYENTLNKNRYEPPIEINGTVKKVNNT